MRSPFSPVHLFLILALTLWIIFAINLHLIALTLAKLRLEPGSALLLLMTSLFGSVINLPLLTLRASAPMYPAEMPYRGLLRLKDIRKLGAPVASIGGAGTFDGIFMTGLVAVLLT